MTDQPYRRTDGGLIDRSRPLSFSFDGKRLKGYQGDTLASALLANGERLVARSFKYHRPRGIYSAGVEEPNALVTLRSGAQTDPNTRATMTELYDGLEARSQHNWPSLRFDVGAVNSLAAPFIPAGFYYKTFMGPKGWWERYEHFIRKAAGMGEATREPDPDRYEKQYAHCDVCVVGSGPSGLMAARTAAEGGARVLLIEDMPDLGGRLRRDRFEIDGKAASDWVRETEQALRSMDNVTVLTRTTAFGYYDHNTIGAVERVSDHLLTPEPFRPRQRHWTIRATRVILTTGAIEQPLVFAGNDRPGVMLAGAVRAYINEYGVMPGKRAVIFTNNDDAYRTALDLHAAGATVEAIVDFRETTESPLAKEAEARKIPILTGHAVVEAKGGATGLKSVEVIGLSHRAGQRSKFDADLLCVSGGWAPTLHLHSQSGGKAAWDAEKACFRPGTSKQAEQSAGSSNAAWGLGDCLREGYDAAKAALEAVGKSAKAPALPKTDDPDQAPITPVWDVGAVSGNTGKRFVDIQDDVSADDVALAHREGYISVEHLKRYTTLGMGTDQGKTSNVNGLAIMAGLRGEDIPQVGTTTFRPPYTPIAVGALAGPDVRSHFAPVRRTPIHDWHEQAGCTWIDAGIWLRPRYYGQGNETMTQACNRETIQTRTSVAICDVSTLGKIDVQGPDAAEFLNRLYTNGFKKLPVGKARYGLMLREDGIVDDDGTTSRLSETHYFLTTTTANAAKILARMEFLLQAEWPDLRVHVTSASDQWAGIAIAGPNSRKLLQKLVDIDISNDAVPFMGVRDAKIAGIDGRVFRISFSGELAYEVTVPADYGTAIWEKCLEAGQEFSAVPYGMEALGTMRIEKGHVAGPELNGETTATDLGLGGMQSSKKRFVGDVLRNRPDLTVEDRKKLVGLVPVDGKTSLKQGAQIIERANMTPPVEMVGHVTSTAFSPELDTPVALGLLKGGMAREGETVYMAYPLRDLIVPMKVVSPHMIDPEGARLHA